MKNYYFTFGVDSPLRDKYIKISALSPEKARTIMFEKFGDKFASFYTEEVFLPQIEKYRYSCLANYEYVEFEEVE